MRSRTSTDRRSPGAAPTFLTRGRLAQRYGVSTRTVARLVASDGFPDAIVINRRPLWRVDLVEAYEESHRRVRGTARLAANRPEPEDEERAP
jgi:hypothetical protein